MKYISYAGQTVMTSDEIAEILVQLTASIANEGEAEAVTIPIWIAEENRADTADLVIGQGNDVLSTPMQWDDGEPDYSADAARLRRHQLQEPTESPADDTAGLGIDFDPDLTEDYTRA
jgi:hypothetical protein